jgi:hypothetical protein
MVDETRLDAAAVRNLAAAADLPLDAARSDAIAGQLSAWLTAANELSRKMSSEDHWTMTPVTVFMHPATEGSEE